MRARHGELTDKNADGNYFYPKCFEKCDGLGASRKCDNCEITTSICEKLGKYEDLEEQGRLVKLPCKVGDTVYKVNKASKKVSQHKVIKFEIDKADATSYTMQIFFENFDFCFLHHFGEEVFLTKSEAEAKLKELRGGAE